MLYIYNAQVEQIHYKIKKLMSLLIREDLRDSKLKPKMVNIPTIAKLSLKP